VRQPRAEARADDADDAAPGARLLSRGCNTHRIEVRRDKTSGLPLPLSASEVKVALVLGRSPGGVDLVKTLVVGTRRVHSADDGSRNGVPLQGLATTA
jgi:hypothetical protein